MQIYDTTRRHGGGLGSPASVRLLAQRRNRRIISCPLHLSCRDPGPGTNLPSPELVISQSANLEQPTAGAELLQWWRAQFMQSDVYSSSSLTPIILDSTNFGKFSL